MTIEVEERKRRGRRTRGDRTGDEGEKGRVELGHMDKKPYHDDNKMYKT